MESGIASAFARLLAVFPSEWLISSLVQDWPIYSVERPEPNLTQRSIKVQSIDEWRASGASYDPPFQLAVIPVEYEAKNRYTHPTTAHVLEDSSNLLKDVFRSFDIPEAVLSSFDGTKYQFIKFPSTSPSSKAYLLAMRNWCVAWNSDSTSGRARAVLLWRPISNMKEEVIAQVHGFLEDIVQSTFINNSAGLLAIMLCLRSNTQFLLKSIHQARDIRFRLEGIISGKYTTQTDDELSSLTADQHRTAMGAIRERFMTSVALSYLDYLLDNSHNPGPQITNGTERENLETLQCLANSHIAQITFVIEETNMNLSTIYNLTAQRDQSNGLAIAAASREIALQSRIDQEHSLVIANASQRLAEESRRDSRAMKMIAIVTMVYLPGTFVATAFSMGIFDWSAAASPDVVSSRIWVYFLFTGVLTVLTVGGFLTWTWWQERKPRLPQGNTK